MSLTMPAHWPDLDDFFDPDANLRPDWHCDVISIHDHWLSATEADSHWMCYPVASRTEAHRRAFDHHASQFMQLFERLVSDTALTLASTDGNADQRMTDRTPDRAGQGTDTSHRDRLLPLNAREARRLCLANLQEKQFDAFVSLQMPLVLLGNHDLSWPLFTRRDHPDVRARLRQWVTSCGLFWLDSDAAETTRPS